MIMIIIVITCCSTLLAMFCKTQICLPSVNMHHLAMHAELKGWFYAIAASYLILCLCILQKIVEQVEKIISTK